MGVHYAQDLTMTGEMTWKAANMMPIVPMYNDETLTGDNAGGTINAFLFASQVV